MKGDHPEQKVQKQPDSQVDMNDHFFITNTSYYKSYEFSVTDKKACNFHTTSYIDQSQRESYTRSINLVKSRLMAKPNNASQATSATKRSFSV